MTRRDLVDAIANAGDEPQRTDPPYHAGDHPHPRSCEGCRRTAVCWACGASATAVDRCTAGACFKCHRRGTCAHEIGGAL